MKNHYRFPALLISCTLACAAPMNALCREAAPAGETAAAAETEAVELQDPVTGEQEEEAEGIDEITEEIIEETSNGAGIRDDGIVETADEPVFDEELEIATEEADDTEPSQHAEAEEAEAPAAIEGYCGEELKWEYADGILSIRGTGRMYAYDEEHQPEWSVFAEETRELRIEKGITFLDTVI